MSLPPPKGYKKSGGPHTWGGGGEDFPRCVCVCVCVFNSLLREEKNRMGGMNERNSTAGALIVR